MMEEMKLYTSFFSAWGWQILAIIFLCFGLLFIALPNSLTTNVFSVSFIVLFGICEAVTLKRRREFYEHC